MIAIITVEEPLKIILSREEAVIDKNALELVTSDEAVSILIDSREGIAWVEAGTSEKASADVLSARLNAKVDADGSEEQLTSVAGEVLRTRSSQKAVVSSSKLQGGRIRYVLWGEGILELKRGDSTLASPVVALNEEENILREGIDTIDSKGIT